MDSDSKSTKSEEDSTTKHVLEYYRNFSLNKDLPKYFTGTSVSYLPEIKDEVETEPPEIIIKTDVGVVINMNEADQNERIDLSPASSVMSNRKLEWDSGADIGYSNCLADKKIHKSSSLPILSELAPKQVEFELPNDKTPKSVSSGSSNLKLVIFPYSSSSEEFSPDSKCYSSSSSLSKSKVQVASSSSSARASTNNKDTAKIITNSSDSSSTSHKISSFKSTLSHLKKKIGLPDAQSTPNSLEDMKSKSGIPDTPVMKNRDKPVKQLLVNVENSEVTSKEVPEDIQNAREKSPQRSEIPKSNDNQVIGPSIEDGEGIKITKPIKRVVNLCLTKPMSVECISDVSLLPSNKNIQTHIQQMTVAVQTDHISEKELIKIASLSQQNLNQYLQFLEHRESDETNVGSTQTESNLVASKCDSFEFVKFPDKESYECEKSDKSDKSYESSSEKLLLAEAISTDKLENTGDDIEKTIYVLHKLLRSKKYDSSTKRHYVKRIIKKLTQSKYLEESSTSSELFLPKKTSKTEVQAVAQVKIIPHSTDSSEEKSQQSEMMQSRFVRHPVSDGNLKISPRKRKALQIKTVCQEIVPNSAAIAKDNVSSASEIFPVEARDMRKSLFTVTHNKLSINENALRSGSAQATVSKNDNSSLKKNVYSSTTSKSSYHNWKEDKTMSEKFNRRDLSNGQGDYLINIADREREYQINWIDREINHLGKLKHLLKKPTTSRTIENMQKTTSVYTVSKTEDTQRRKFVIETKLDGECSRQRNFQLAGKNYLVEDLTDSDRELKNPRPVLADIEVYSSDTTTNIIVTTVCEVCKRGPCICGNRSRSRKRSNFQHDLAKENVCVKCCRRACTCSSTIDVKSCETICLSCHKAPCICSTNYTSTGTTSKRCSSCSSYPCECYPDLKASLTGRSDDHEGHFIPAVVPKLNLNERSDEELLFSSRSRMPSKPFSGCRSCGKGNCFCARLDKDIISKKGISSRRSSESLGTLSKVFVNCKCNIKSSCNCDFVEKLLRHFNRDELFRDINFEDTGAQTKLDNINAGVQSQVDTNDEKQLSDRRKNTEASQTYGSRVREDPQDLSVQTLVQTNHQKLQTPSDQLRDFASVAVETEKIPLQSARIQAASQDNTTMTEGEKATSTEDLKKRSLFSVDKSTTYDKGYLEEGNEKGSTSRAVETEKIPYHSEKIQATLRDNTTVTESDKATSTEKVLKQDLIPERTTSDPESSVPRNQRYFASVAVETEKIPQKSMKIQTAPQNDATMTESVKATSTEDLQKEDWISVTSTRSEKENSEYQIDHNPHSKTDISRGVQMSSAENVGKRKLITDHKGTTYDENWAFERENIHPRNIRTQSAPQQNRNMTVTSSVKKQHLIIQSTSKKEHTDMRESPSIVDVKEHKQYEQEKNGKQPEVERPLCVCTKTQTDGDSQVSSKSGTSSSSEKMMTRRISFTCSDPHCQENKRSTQVERKQKSVNTKVRSDTSEKTSLSEFSSQEREDITDSKPHSTNVSKDNVCVCGFVKKGRRRGEDKMEKNSNQSESIKSSMWKDTSKMSSPISTTNGTNFGETLSEETPSQLTICMCCKQQATYEDMTVFNSNEQDYLLCRSCLQKRPILTSVCYTGPERVCSCYKPEATTAAVCDRFRRIEEYCTCTKLSAAPNNRGYCCHCQSKLRRTHKSQNGIAYTLTLESESPRKLKSVKKKSKRLEEIKVKVPDPHSRKKHKEKENFSKRETRRTAAEVRGVNGSENHTRSQSDGSKRDDNGEGVDHRKVKKENFTLQEHLMRNRPDFINSAECRRQAVNNFRSERQLTKDDHKLKFVENNVDPFGGLKGKNIIFSEKEMKEINKRNYKKLPEVQRRLNNMREQKLRSADRMIADTFNRKIRRSVLKGKRTFPLDINIVNMPK